MVVKTLTTYRCIACGGETYCMLAMVNNDRPTVSFVCPRGGTNEAVWQKVQEMGNAETS
jgi:hypothetical protein